MMGDESFQQYPTMTDPAFFCELSHEGVISVQGPDAGKFLQGQLTCNINYLNAATSSLGARCTPKGRMLSSFRIVARDDAFLLAMAGELLAGQLLDLKKYAAFSKVQLADNSADWARFGLQHADALLAELGLALLDDAGTVAHAADMFVVQLGDDRAELWVTRERAAEVRQRLSAALSPAPLQRWLLGQIRAGIGQVFGETRELFIPQMINLQAVGGVSFKKGCYAGQEIVARMQYLGKLKRRLYRLSMADDQAPAPGTELFSPVHGSSIGETVLAAAAESGVELLAVLQQDAVNDGRIHLGSADGPALTVQELPYSLDKDREIQH